MSTDMLRRLTNCRLLLLLLLLLLGGTLLAFMLSHVTVCYNELGSRLTC